MFRNIGSTESGRDQPDHEPDDRQHQHQHDQVHCGLLAVRRRCSSRRPKAHTGEPLRTAVDARRRELDTTSGMAKEHAGSRLHPTRTAQCPLFSRQVGQRQNVRRPSAMASASFSIAANRLSPRAWPWFRCGAASRHQRQSRRRSGARQAWAWVRRFGRRRELVGVDHRPRLQPQPSRRAQT
jgi:hypothetical protein